MFNGGYQDNYCIMGGKKFSLLFNAKQRDACGLLPDAEKAVINSSKKNIKLIPLHKTGPGIRAGLIQIDKELSSPLIARENTVKINGTPVSIQKPFPNATAKIDLYVEYRRAESYDKNLSNDLFVENTNGLMIHLAFNNVKIPPSTINWPDGSKLDVNQSWIDIFEPWFNTYSWLLDMSPHNGFTSVTLNQGWQFYHDDWEVTIRNIRPDGDNGITFDVDYGKRTDVVTGVHRCPTAGTACDDGQASTKDDKEDGNCNCAGTPCPAAGTACDDGQANTKDDKEDGNCNCAGTPCPAAGTACDDGQASTKDDKEDGNCNCAGTPCPAAGAACDDGNPNTKNDVEDGNCNCAGTPCPVAGAACDDGNPDTVSDKEDGNCNCAGIPKVNLGGGQGGKAILEKISPEMMAKIQAQGMPIYGGNNPPNVEGTYLFTEFILKSSTNPQGGAADQVGHKFADFKLTLSDQTTYNIKMSYVNGPEHGEGIGSFIVGEGENFTVVAELDIKLNGAPAKVVIIISGTLTANGINNAHYANFMLDNYGNTGFMNNEEGRIIIDKDGLAGKVQN